ncbi:DHHW family protein, partial [uncultured Dubosiella sp.]
KQAIEYYYSLYKKAKGINMIDDLIKNNDKPLYFKTDHHWSADGAYYAYKNFAKEKGFKARSLSDYESKVFSPFYGSYLNEIAQGQLEADSLTVYVPKSTNDMMVYDAEGGIPTKEQLNEPGTPANIITLDDSLYDENNHYLRFINGDTGFKVIDNPKINDGSSVLVIKESYGNSFVPFLVDHYDKVYIADFRYCDMQIVTWCKENNITDLILMNNIQLIANEGVAQWYDELLV